MNLDKLVSKINKSINVSLILLTILILNLGLHLYNDMLRQQIWENEQWLKSHPKK